MIWRGPPNPLKATRREYTGRCHRSDRTGGEEHEQVVRRHTSNSDSRRDCRRGGGRDRRGACATPGSHRHGTRAGNWWLFFRAKDPKKLAGWYEANLGVSSVPGNYDTPPWRTSAGTTVFAPFKEDTSYF